MHTHMYTHVAVNFAQMAPQPWLDVSRRRSIKPPRSPTEGTPCLMTIGRALQAPYLAHIYFAHACSYLAHVSPMSRPCLAHITSLMAIGRALQASLPLHMSPATCDM